MNNSYIPHPSHFAFAIIAFVIGTPFLLKPGWEYFGIACWVIGIVIVVLISWSTVWDVFVRKAQALQYLFDSTKHLDDDRVDRLLYAMGLSIKTRAPNTNISVTVREPNGTMSKKRYLTNVPATPDQLLQLAHGLIVENAPFSRPEWVNRRSVFSDGGFRTLKEYLLREKLIEPKNPQNLNDGYRLTTGPEGGYEILKGYLPSPTPSEEVTQNQAI